MSYIRDRLIQAVITLFSIITLGFVLNKVIPGGPVEYLQRDMRENPELYGLPDNPPDDLVNSLIRDMVSVPPDLPLWEAYLQYMYAVIFEFDLGNSIIVASGVDVTTLVLSRAPWTIFLSSIGLVYALVVGIFLGSLMAYYEGSKFDIGTTLSMVVSGGIPYYIAAIFLLFFFGYTLGWFPTGGKFNPDTTAGMNWPWVSSVFYYATLPALSFILTGFGGYSLGVRANSIRLLGSEHLRNAQLRGLSRYRISVAYLARNAILPIYTSVVIGLGALLGGSVILEQIFQYPGMGLLLFEAVVSRDFPVVMGAFIITTVLFIIGTLLADFTYPLIDPRADVKASKE